MWTWGTNDGDGEYLAGEADSLEELLLAMAELKRAKLERYVHGDDEFHLLVARMRDDGQVGFVALPQFARDGNFDPPDEAVPYSSAQLLELEAAATLFVETDQHCGTCAQQRHGYLANRAPSGAPYFACLTCQRWTEIETNVAPLGHRTRPSSLAE